MNKTRMYLKVAAVVIFLVVVAMPVVWAGGTLSENNTAGNGENGGWGAHSTGDNTDEELVTSAFAWASTDTSTQYTMVQEDAWGWDGNNLAADIEGYDTGDNWAWSTEFEMEGAAKVSIGDYVPQTNPPTTYYGEARSILELTDLTGDWWPEFSEHVDETVSRQQEFNTTVEVLTSAGASYSLLGNVREIHVMYETRNYVEAETDRAEIKVNPHAHGEVDPDSDWYMKLIRLDDGEVLDEWDFD